MANSKYIVIVVSVALAIIQGANSVVAQEFLTEDELSAMLSGKIWMIDGGSRLIWSSDGTLCVEGGPILDGEGTSRSVCGTWRQEEDKFCMKIKGLRYDHCLLGAKVGNKKFDALMDEGKLFFSWSMP